MSSTLKKAEAEGAAKDVIQRLGITVLPVCPLDIATREGINVVAKPPGAPGVSGFLVRVGNEFSIGYSQAVTNEGFIRFTVGHELGHYFLPGHPEALFPHGDGVHESKSGFVSSNEHERQADHFAAALLMPKELFLHELRRVGSGFDAVERLSLRCKTSITATAIRFAGFTDDAVAVIMSAGQSIKWSCLSRTLKELKKMEWKCKTTGVPRSTATAVFNQRPENISEAKRDEGLTTLDNWFNGAPAVEMEEHVVGLGSYGRTLTILTATKAVDYDEINEEFDEDEDEDGGLPSATGRFPKRSRRR